MYSSTPFRSWLLSDGSSCGDRQELANKLGKSSCAESVFNRFGGGSWSAEPGGGNSAESRGSIRLAWICSYVTLFWVLAASVRKGARTSFMGTGFWAVATAEALPSSASHISLR